MRSVIIFGLGATRELCPFDEETWGVNMSYAYITKMKGRLDKLFIGHSPYRQYPYLLGPKGEIRGMKVSDWGWDFIAGLAQKIEVITLHRIKGIKSKLYPLRRISKKFNTEYFADTICYMLAYAVYKRYDRIRIYGVDMRDKLEYIWEKPGIEYWIGFARGKGVQVDLPEGSNLLKTQGGMDKGIINSDVDYSEVQPRKRTGKSYAIDG